ARWSCQVCHPNGTVPRSMAAPGALVTCDRVGSLSVDHTAELRLQRPFESAERTVARAGHECQTEHADRLPRAADVEQCECIECLDGRVVGEFLPCPGQGVEGGVGLANIAVGRGERNQRRSLLLLCQSEGERMLVMPDCGCLSAQAVEQQPGV